LAGEHEEALGEAGRAVELEPDYGLGWFQRAVAFGNLQRYEEALDAIDNAIERSGADSEALVVKSVVLASLEQPDEALDAASQASELAPSSFEARMQKGAALQSVERHEDAVDEFRSLVVIDVENSQTWEYLGFSYEALGRHESAARAFRRGFAVASKSPSMAAGLATSLISAGRDAEAVEFLQARATTQPFASHAICNFNLGLALSRVERYSEATVALKHAISIWEASSDNPRELTAA